MRCDKYWQDADQRAFGDESKHGLKYAEGHCCLGAFPTVSLDFNCSLTAVGFVSSPLVSMALPACSLSGCSWSKSFV